MIVQKEISLLISFVWQKIKSYHLDYLILLPILFFIASQIIIPLPFSAVPLSLQPLPVLLAARFMGARGVAGYAVYLLQGAMGLPIFSGFSGSLLHLLGPTGGYLIGFLFGAIVIATTSLHARSAAAAYGWYVCAMAIVFLCGLLQLMAFVPAKTAVLQGLLPFIIGDFVLKPLIFVGAVSLCNKLFFKLN